MPAPFQVDELLSQMGSEPVDDAVSSKEERARVVARMKQLHVELVHERGRRFATRKRAGILLVAAVAAFAGSAFAGAAGYGPLARWFRTTQPTSIPATAVTSSVTPPLLTRNAEPSARALVSPPPQVETPVSLEPIQRNARAVRTTPSPTERERELEAVNRLFADAKRARREHRDSDALALLEELLSQYPRSLLAHEASVERFRTLARLGRKEEARRRAAAYLTTYPKGFAAEEARALAEPSAP